MNKMPFLIGKWTDRINKSGWHAYRIDGLNEDEITRIVYCDVVGSGPEKRVDILHEGIGCHRVPFDTPIPRSHFIYLDLEKLFNEPGTTQAAMQAVQPDCKEEAYSSSSE